MFVLEKETSSVFRLLVNNFLEGEKNESMTKRNVVKLVPMLEYYYLITGMHLLGFY